MSNGKVVIVTLAGSDQCETKRFEGDELTSSEQQAIIWLREQQQDALDHE